MWNASHPYGRSKQGTKTIDTPRIHVPSWSWASVTASSYGFVTTKALKREEKESLLTNAQFPDDLNDAERFVPTSSISLRFRAPCCRLPTDWMRRTQRLESDDLSLVVFDYCLRKVYTADGCEVRQKHTPYLDQHFVAIQLRDYIGNLPEPHRSAGRSYGRVRTARATSFLILESVSNVDTPQYRRIMLLRLMENRIPWFFHRSTTLRRLGDSEGKPVCAKDAWRLIKQHPWDIADITLRTPDSDRCSSSYLISPASSDNDMRQDRRQWVALESASQNLELRSSPV
nr:hypothetical protein CFP56_52190 [Quercus suber]